MMFVLRSCPEQLSVQFWTNRAPTPEPQEQTPPAQQAEPEPLQSQVAGGSPSVEEPHGSVEEEAHKSQCNAPTEQAASAQGPLDDPPEATPEAMENTRPAAASRSPEPSRLRQVLDRARDRLDALGNRLDQAFSRIRDRFLDHDKHRKKEANAAEGNDDARKARDRQERAQQLARELLRRWDDQKKHDGPSR
jgi:hypothetical protein